MEGLKNHPFAIGVLIHSACLVMLVSTTISAQGNGDQDGQGSGFHGRQELVGKKSVKSSAKLASVLWPPADVDAAVPPVAPETTCPLEEVLGAASQRAQEFAANLEHFTATETIDTIEIGKDGRSKKSLNHKFNYLALVSERRDGGLVVDESRVQTGKANSESMPIQSVGLAIGAVVFHPANIRYFKMACEGLGEWHNEPAWQVHFEEHSDKSIVFQGVLANQKWFNVRLRGRAWITADSFQIARIEFDLLKAIPQIRFLTEHMSVDYRAVNFNERKIQLWLPESVNLYIDIGGHRFLNRHRLNNYLLFAVNSQQEIHSIWMPN
jgi:hypothetical protein